MQRSVERERLFRFISPVFPYLLCPQTLERCSSVVLKHIGQKRSFLLYVGMAIIAIEDEEFYKRLSCDPSITVPDLKTCLSKFLAMYSVSVIVLPCTRL